jgi:hypothetical protein
VLFLVALAIGLAINIAVSWWLLALTKPPTTKQVLGTRSEWIAPVPADWPPPGPDSSGYVANWGLTFRSDRAQVSVTGQPYDPSVPMNQRLYREYSVHRFASGFPVRSFEAIWWQKSDPTAQGADRLRNRIAGIRIPQIQKTPTIRDGMLPILPLWPGAAVNTLLYSSPLLLWWFVLPWARARRRRATGRCAGCGFERGSLPAAQPCPECGHVAPGV